MQTQFKKIRLFKDLTIILQDNKIVFYNPLLKNNHITFHLGDNSGIFDLHLKNQEQGNYFTILQIAHTELYQILLPLFTRIFTTVFSNLKEIDPEEIIKTNSKIVQFSDISLSDAELLKLKKRGALDLDPESDKFQEFYSTLSNKSRQNEISLKDAQELHEFTGYITNENESYLVIKSPYANGRIARFDSINLSLKSILINVLGEDNFEVFNMKFLEGMEFLNNNKDSICEPLTVSAKKTTDS